ncbi:MULTISPECIES: heavy metal translocating P-type ATPase [Odoribacter]|jgi:heavy metal-(Cd/Co/Hg/Pb/Zn)-translocating P-type ATPase|uniref:P-type Zn(2+) transporter n=3 Tax=Odoribacter splanchnicus TaxID=28118 RepID=A0A412TQN2_9BACT|nr:MULTISPECIES: heavy metal translocating P-type ATPase [Odoribacter]MBP8907047.1 cadmium-translocating P-type ATPase [Odoribacter sp.]MBS1354403.1 cadmium-translocating P-type ATPase [Odoribacter sp.]MDB9211512.1 heavy metal translocating P-type ATPase [Odoribacter splanchnicus]MDB9226912.1 heavy metal translocating P-type ATPase [Odoribacter splanchnicus]MDB9237645.1 heavy metal translocating P-type ATPase [Odoribacter splanchnicus]
MEATCQRCAHTHTHAGDCGHTHDQQGTGFLILSFLLLVGGVILRYLQLPFWMIPGVEVLWFLLAFLPVGFPVMVEVWKSIRQKDIFNEFSLMLLATIGAFCIGEYPEGVAVMLFYSVGERVQHRAVDRARRNIRRLLDVRPEKALVLRQGKEQSVFPGEVEVGEMIMVKPGERIPLDGLLQEEYALFDTSALTGESLPRTINRGEEVLAGMIVSGQAIRLKVTKPYEQSALARILALVQDASERKAPAELFIRRFARIYTPVVFLLALSIMLLPALVAAFHPGFDYFFKDWAYRGLVFLVISCPCALVISVPLGYFGGIGAASRKGILFKGGNYLDAITHVNTVVFDKTGTLTTGHFQVSSMEADTVSSQRLLSILLTLEEKSTHPVAQAVTRYALQEGAGRIGVTHLQEYPGYGLEGVIEGKNVLVGNIRLLTDRGITVPAGISERVATVVVCAIAGKYAGHLLLSDTLKADAVEAIGRLKQLHIDNIQLLSGDKKEIVAIFAKTLGIRHARGGLLPEDKAAYLEKLNAEAGVSAAFVGDGMNDAPVLALSDVGIAMGGLGADAAIESADVVIQTDQPSKVATAISIGRATRRIVKQNIAGAIGVKSLILIAGACGFVTLWAAVFADVGVALLAVLNSVRILSKKFE